MNRNIKLSLLAIALATTGSVAYAATGNQVNDATAQHSLAQAVAAAEGHAKGKAIKAEYDKSDKGNYYEIEVLSGDKATEVKVDAAKGTIIKSTDEKADTKDTQRVSHAKMTLSQAIAAAEQHAKGKADKAKLDSDDGSLRYKVEVVTNSGEVDVTLDATTSTVLSSVAEEADND